MAHTLQKKQQTLRTHDLDHHLLTERRKEERAKHLTNDDVTPQKLNDHNLLRKLDETETKLAIAERNYSDVWRKCQHLRQQSDLSQENRLRELIDLKNKLNLLQQDSQAQLSQLHSKQATINLLRDKLRDKNDQLIICEQNLQKVNIMLEERSTRRSEREREKQVKAFNIEECSPNFHSLVHQHTVQTVAEELARFERLIAEKEMEKKELIRDIEKIYGNHRKEKEDLQGCCDRMEAEYREWIDRLTDEKNQQRQHYETLLSLGSKKELQKKSHFISDQTTESMQTKNKLMELQHNQLQLQDQNKSLFMKAQAHETAKQEYTNNITHLHSQLQQLLKSEAELNQQVTSYKQLKQLNDIQIQSSKGQMEQLSNQLEELTYKYDRERDQVRDLQKGNQQLATQLRGLKEENRTMRGELSSLTSKDLTINQQLTDATDKLNRQIEKLDQEKQSLIQKLYAQRLQNMALKQDLQDMKNDLTKEYELSLSNLKMEHKVEVKTLHNQKNIASEEREAIYLEMKELEKKYELLACEIVTVDEMMGMVTKTHKRNNTHFKRY